MLKTNGGIPEDEIEFSFIETNLLNNETYNQGSDIHYFYNSDEFLSVSNSFSNAQVIERVANSAKSNQILFTDADYIFYSIPDKSNTLATIFSGITGTNSFTQGMYNAFKEEDNEK